MLIAHHSDPHVRPDGALYQGLVDSNAQFAAAIKHVNALDPRPDFVLLSGDLVDHGHAAEYDMLVRLPGPLEAVSEEGAAWLDRMLAAEPSRPTIVMMHQSPFDTGIPYMDLYSCREGSRLSAVLARHPQVERLLCGHVHRASASARCQASLVYRAASDSAPSVAGRDRTRHALCPDRGVSRTFPLRLSPAREYRAVWVQPSGGSGIVRARCAPSRSPTAPATNIPSRCGLAITG
jgi:hypothetical protein